MTSINFWQWSIEHPPVGWHAINAALFLSGLAWATARPLRSAFSHRHRSIKSAIGAAPRAPPRAIPDQLGGGHTGAAVAAVVRDMRARSAPDGERERLALVAEAQAQVLGLGRDGAAQSAYLTRQAQQRLRQGLLDEAVHGADVRLAGILSDADRARLNDEAIAQLQALPAAEVAR